MFSSWWNSQDRWASPARNFFGSTPSRAAAVAAAKAGHGLKIWKMFGWQSSSHVWISCFFHISLMMFDIYIYSYSNSMISYIYIWMWYKKQLNYGMDLFYSDNLWIYGCDKMEVMGFLLHHGVSASPAPLRHTELSAHPTPSQHRLGIGHRVTVRLAKKPQTSGVYPLVN